MDAGLFGLSRTDLHGADLSGVTGVNQSGVAGADLNGVIVGVDSHKEVAGEGECCAGVLSVSTMSWSDGGGGHASDRDCVLRHYRCLEVEGQGDSGGGGDTDYDETCVLPSAAPPPSHSVAPETFHSGAPVLPESVILYFCRLVLVFFRASRVSSRADRGN